MSSPPPPRAPLRHPYLLKLELDDYDAAYDDEAYPGNISMHCSYLERYSLTRLLEMSEAEQSNQADVFRAKLRLT